MHAWLAHPTMYTCFSCTVRKNVIQKPSTCLLLWFFFKQLHLPQLLFEGPDRKPSKQRPARMGLSYSHSFVFAMHHFDEDASRFLPWIEQIFCIVQVLHGVNVPVEALLQGLSEETWRTTTPTTKTMCFRNLVENRHHPTSVTIKCCAWSKSVQPLKWSAAVPRGMWTNAKSRSTSTTGFLHMMQHALLCLRDKRHDFIKKVIGLPSYCLLWFSNLALTDAVVVL